VNKMCAFEHCMVYSRRSSSTFLGRTVASPSVHFLFDFKAVLNSNNSNARLFLTPSDQTFSPSYATSCRIFRAPLKTQFVVERMHVAVTVGDLDSDWKHTPAPPRHSKAAVVSARSSSVNDNTVRAEGRVQRKSDRFDEVNVCVVLWPHKTCPFEPLHVRGITELMRSGKCRIPDKNRNPSTAIIVIVVVADMRVLSTDDALVISFDKIIHVVVSVLIAVQQRHAQVLIHCRVDTPSIQRQQSTCFDCPIACTNSRSRGRRTGRLSADAQRPRAPPQQ
jgi:hypothetical protein